MKVDLKALKMNVDLVAILQALGVPLKPKGANFVAPCVFHREKTASFTVNPERRIWKCFGCNVGGDVFKFVKLKENLTLPQAIQRVQGFAPPEQPPGPPAAVALPAAAAPTPTTGHDVDHAPQVVLDRVIAHWQKALANAPKAQAYLKARGLWNPELLRALKVGYSSGSLARTLPGGGKLRDQLTQIGILNARGNEFFFGRIVIPLFADDRLVGVYGRAISSLAKVEHLYLQGPRRGVFNPPGIRDAREVLLTESPLDALSLLVLGFPHTTTSFGAGGFTADVRAALVKAGTTRVYCVYDLDPAGDTGADQLAHTLAGHGIEVWRVVMPCKDPNEFLTSGGSREDFQKLIDAARPMVVSGAPRSVAPAASAPQSPPDARRPPPVIPAPVIAAAAMSHAPPAVVPSLAPLELVLGDRTYQLEGEPVRVGDGLRVRVRAARGGRHWVETFNVHSPHARSTFSGTSTSRSGARSPRRFSRKTSSRSLTRSRTAPRRRLPRLPDRSRRR